MILHFAFLSLSVGVQMVLAMARLLGSSECSSSSHEKIRSKLLLRLLTPSIKAWVTKMSTNVLTECIECFGGIVTCSFALF